MSEKRASYGTEKDDEKTKVIDEGGEHIYFTITPRLVWALCEDPYEYTLWCVIKDIAGEKGECILSREDIAYLSMMSAGKASQCRDSLIAKKLLRGEFVRDPGYPQKVWHLTIPDFWDANTTWAQRHPKIKDRVSFKKEQKKLRDFQRASRGDGSQDASQNDEGMTPRDGGVSPDDTKKNVLKNQLEEPKEKFLKIISHLAPSVFGNNMTTWWEVRRRLEDDSVTISGEVGQPNPDKPVQIVIGGLNQYPKGGQFSEAEIWHERFYRAFANLGLEIAFQEAG